MPKKIIAFAVSALMLSVALLWNAGSAQNQNQRQRRNANRQRTLSQQQNDTQLGTVPVRAPVAVGVKNAPPIAEYVEQLIGFAREGGAEVLSNGDSYDDFPSLTQTSDGTIYAAYAAFYDNHDQIRLHRRLADGWWSTRTYVPLAQARSDIWMPQLAVDAQDRVWVIWAEQTGQSKGKTGNWDLYARPFQGDSWGKLHRLTDDPKPDINPHVVTDADKNIHVVWQAHPENNGDVQYCRFDGKSWSKPLSVTSDEESDWFPRAAVDKDGKVWIAFDSYRNGDYDVFLTSVEGKTPGQVVPIAASTYYEAHASVACTPDGGVWVSWEQGGHNWGKDQGYWLRQENRNQGTTLGSTRAVKVACWRDGKVLAAPDVASVMPEGEKNQPTAISELTTGADGRLWLKIRHLVRGRQRGRGRFTRGWVERITTLGKDGWTESQVLPGSAGRISVFNRTLPLPNGSVMVAYAADARDVSNYHRPIQDTVLSKIVMAPEGEVGAPELAAYEPPAPPAGIPTWNTRQEKQQLAAIRGVRKMIDGVEHRIVRGDLHRHSELSWDVGPGNDGSYLDFYRYMIDVAGMDFGGLTDHQGGGHYPYWWWLSEKAADMFYLAPRFVPLYTYERSVTFPHGHRNVLHAYRGVPIFPFQEKLAANRAGVYSGIGSGKVVDNDTKLLYEFLKGTGGLAISHTSGTSSMGTDWRDNDPWAEPVVEIYQGARNSYEALGAPRVHSEEEPPGKAPGGFQKAGMLWNAYAKGYRLGITASSDHGSTHISYSLVYTPKNDRREILDSIRKRHTYGATDNLIVDFTANGNFMGDEFKTGDKPSLKLTVTGTGKIAKLDLIRNNKYIYATEPGDDEVEFQYTDKEPEQGTNLYYIRILQTNGELAWSSPVWVNYGNN